MAVSQMDYEALERVAKGFKDSGEMLQGIDKFIEGLLMALRTQSFIGLVSAAMLDSYSNSVRIELAKVVETFAEMSDDLTKTVARTRDTDETTSGNFK